jgi:CRISPR-associated protein Cas6
MKVDVSFPIVRGSVVPKDHGYSLFSAISRLIPSVHSDPEIDILRVRGQTVFKQYTKALDGRVLVRLPEERFETLAPLQGAELDLDGHKILLGDPDIVPLRPHRELYASNVVIRFTNGPLLPDTKRPDFKACRVLFERAIDKQLNERGIAGRRVIGELPTRLKVSGYMAFGWPMQLYPNSSEDSIRAQELGLGSRRHMGCGTFVEVGT